MSESERPLDAVELRKLQNRISARKSRQRHALRVMMLENQLAEREREIELLKKLVAVLTEQKKRLEAQI